MSYPQRIQTTVAFVATAFVAAALPVVGAGTAQASGVENCDPATIQYRIAGTDADWTSTGGFHRWEEAPSTLEVRLAPNQNIADGCTYPVSLAVYETEGPDWPSSGLQTFIEKDTVYLTAEHVAGRKKGDRGREWPSLSVTPPDCYGQIDLYGDDITYDGQDKEGHGPAPYYPDGTSLPNLIAAWNGGDTECVPDDDTPTPPPTPPPGDNPPDDGETPPGDDETPPPDGDDSPPPADDETPPTDSEVPPAQPTPSPSPSPEAPKDDDGTVELANTGISAPVGMLASAAVLVMTIGAGLVYLARRRRQQA